MERIEDTDEGDPVIVHGNRSFLFDYPGSEASVGWQVNTSLTGTRGRFWIGQDEDMVQLYLDASSPKHKAITVSALNSLIAQAREARNFLNAIETYDQNS